MTQENETHNIISDDGNDWIDKLRYSRSFMAKLILSDNAVKEYYAAITARLLSYQKVRSKTGWNGVSFFAGRESIAKITISGKTLCVYLAFQPDEEEGVKYKAKDVSDKRKYQKTPSLYKIKSNGALNHCLKIIDALAAKLDLVMRTDTPQVFTSAFRQDSFNNLVTRGLIRLLKSKQRSEKRDEEGQVEEEKIDNVEKAEAEGEPIFGAFEDADKTVTDLVGRYKVFGDILGAMSSGNAKTRLSQMYMLRCIDETWIKAVEESLPALDELIRNPSHFIAETEEILPIEMTKKITSRSVAHLSRHTDLISKVEGDTVTPIKMLNVFREDSILTYENKFLNTLIYKLFIFVNSRYNTALNYGVDEKVTAIEFEDKFYHDEYKAKVKINVELSKKSNGEERSEEERINRITQSDLWQRVSRLNDVVAAYRSSDFCLAMGTHYVRPPVIRTNAILKNKYFRQCLALWEFIESYEDDGFGFSVGETVLATPDAYVKQLYEQSAIAYFVFRHNALGDYDSESILASFMEQFNLYATDDANERSYVLGERMSGSDTQNDDSAVQTTDSPLMDKNDAGEDDILLAIKVALAAEKKIAQQMKAELERQKAEEQAAILAKQAEEQGSADTETFENRVESDISASDDEDEYSKDGIKYIKSFKAKMMLASEETKEYFAKIANGLLKYTKVKMRESQQYVTFKRGRDLLCKIAVRGKTLCVHFALEPSGLDDKYFITDLSGVRKFAETPSMLKVKSERGVKYAFELIDAVRERFGLTENAKYKESVTAADYPSTDMDTLIASGLVKIVNENGEAVTIDGVKVGASDNAISAVAEKEEVIAEESCEDLIDTKKEPDTVKENVVVKETAGAGDVTSVDNEITKNSDTLSASSDSGEQAMQTDTQEIISEVAASEIAAASDDEDEYSKDGIKYIKSFKAKMMLASEETKEYFAKIANGLLKYTKVKMRESQQYVTFKRGRDLLCKIAVRGKTLCVHFALEPSGLDDKYFITDLSGVRKFAETPSMLKVKSERGVKYAFELIDAVRERFGLTENAKYKESVTAADYPSTDMDTLIASGLVKIVNENGEAVTIDGVKVGASDNAISAVAEKEEVIAEESCEDLIDTKKEPDTVKENVVVKETAGAGAVTSVDNEITKNSDTFSASSDSGYGENIQNEINDTDGAAATHTSDFGGKNYAGLDADSDEAVSLADIAVAVNEEERDVYGDDKKNDSQETEREGDVTNIDNQITKNSDTLSALSDSGKQEKQGKQGFFAKVKSLFSKRR